MRRCRFASGRKPTFSTAAFDSHTEKIIQAELERIAEDRTTLVIAHRLSTVIDADQILVMEGSRIVEQGSHRELLERGEVYARVWALQQEEEAKEAMSRRSRDAWQPSEAGDILRAWTPGAREKLPRCEGEATPRLLLPVRMNREK